MTRSIERQAGFGAVLALAMTALAVLALPSPAAAKDRNHDRIPDRWEKRHRLSLKVNQATRDQDRDHLRNRAEFLAGDNPRDRDSDNDGVADGQENAGTIESFDQGTGWLSIDLFGKGTLGGQVTDATELECERHRGADDASVSAHRDEAGDDEGHHGDEPGDDQDNHEDEAGADKGEHGDEPSDDQGGHGDDDQGEEDRSGACTMADLVPGAIVQEADLHVSGGRAAFEEVELAD